jgi:aromatic-L-amino-acid/L-tryptophan decarboxylase
MTQPRGLPSGSTRPLSDLPPDVLSMDRDEMRQLGYWVVDQVVRHFEHSAEGPAIRVGDPQRLRALFGGDPPRLPGDPRIAMTSLVNGALENMQHGDHPRYFARVPGPSSYAGVLGDWLGTGFQAIASSWAGGSGPATIELVVCEWLAALLNLPASTEGVLVSGGSMANITALAAVRDVLGEGLIYLSDQTHASIPRGLRLAGVTDDDLCVLTSDRHFRMPMDALQHAVDQDRRAGRRPLMVIGTAGTTNSGTVDPLSKLADLCSRENLWFHVDGAYGGPAALCDAGRHALTGIERADSIVLDPHKWLFQPYDVGCLLVTRPGFLERAYAMNPEYLQEVTARPGEIDLRNRSLELTRRCRAIKLWLTFRTYGVDRLSQAIERGIALAEHAEQLLQDDPFWELVTPAQLGVVTFTGGDLDGAHHRAAASALAADGFAALTTTQLHGRTVLRLCTINPRTTEFDIAETLRSLQGLLRGHDIKIDHISAVTAMMPSESSHSGLRS